MNEKEKEKMTRFGVGPIFGLISILFGLAAIYLGSYFKPLSQICFIPYRILAVFGIVLILIGVPFWIAAVYAVMRAFNQGRLAKDGVFGMCRHPVYAAWVVFIVPGIVLLTDSLIGLTVPVVMYFLLVFLVKKEDVFLENTFGDEYIAYKKSVPAVLPIGWIRLRK